jgi:WD40 repeat protein
VHPTRRSGPATVLRRVEDLAHIGPVTGLSFSQDGRSILTSGAMDLLACVWRVGSRTPPILLEGHTGVITASVLSPDGRLAVTASEDSTVRVWRIGWDGLVSHLRGQTTATLNPRERMTLLGETPARAQRAHADAEARFGRSSALSDIRFRYPDW